MTLTTINLAALGDTINLTTEVTGTLPTGNGGTGSTATTFVNAASNVTGTLPVPNGGTGLASGTTDQLLKFTGSTTLASSAISTGKLAQVVQAICAGGDTSTTSSTDQSSNVAVAITPSASDSKVLIQMTFGGSSGNDYNKTLRWRLYRGTTALGNNTSLGNYNGTDDGMRSHNMSITFLDSPSTTSATTYTLKFACSQNDATVSIYASGESQSYAQATEILA